MDQDTKVPQSINALAAAGITKMRKVIWVNKMDHLLILIVDGKLGVWSRLYCPMNKATFGADPISIIAFDMDFDKEEWVAYTGPGAESAEYLAEQGWWAERRSSHGTFTGAGNGTT